MDRKRGNILFDLDGTLTDNQVGIFRCIHYAFKELGVPLEETTDLRWCVGPPLQLSLTQLAGGDPSLGKKALELYRARYRETGIFENRLYDGIIGSLESLLPVFDLYVATSKPKFFSEKILKHFSLDKYFQAIYGSELDGTRTDKGQLIAFLLAEEELDPKTVLMIGDREHDMIGAEKNQVVGLGAGWGFGSEEELMTAGARIVLKTPAELFQFVQDYGNEQR